ncbi:DNA-formamidopyrimidine glycosylase [Deinococcus sp. KNUC1210]|uniref:DNA-formamidopyrimidine glycosylase n=1 Tax=Deinococcus sp. KNUC1210 TaxID=2917691 RepID=UPI001EEFDA74|nr:DNA-formamidopyrimidine glycosylase [Deinococcus sp. KNUC1210]ULH15039.1 DNA-formamidopyrimidine glycosylase [Deinococcus sp. KNUC1210]
MPELPEVETTRLKIEPLLKGRRLLAIEHDAPQRYRDTELAQGRTVSRLSRRGKYLLLELEDPDQEPLELIVHLGMTGGFRLEPSKHTRVTLHLEDENGPSALYFQDSRKFGKMAVVRPGSYAGMPTLANMGPEPLSPDFEEESFVQRVAGQGRMIKPWLLSQLPVAGVGNIYADESLWRARLHPAQTRLSSAEAAALYGAIRTTMQEAVLAGGSTLSDGSYAQPDGVSGLFQMRHNVYDRAGQPCNRCGVPIEKIVLAQRGTHFCPHCQVLDGREEASAGHRGE